MKPDVIDLLMKNSELTINVASHLKDQATDIVDKNLFQYLIDMQDEQIELYLNLNK